LFELADLAAEIFDYPLILLTLREHYVKVGFKLKARLLHQLPKAFPLGHVIADAVVFKHELDLLFVLRCLLFLHLNFSKTFAGSVQKSICEEGGTEYKTS
jgi:hypothetical protein